MKNMIEFKDSRKFSAVFLKIKKKQIAYNEIAVICMC